MHIYMKGKKIQMHLWYCSGAWPNLEADRIWPVGRSVGTTAIKNIPTQQLLSGIVINLFTVTK